MNQQDRMINEYLRAENRILREQLGKKKLWLTDGQRRRLAVLGKMLGRKVLQEWACIVTPDTILRWYRRLIGREVGLQQETRAGPPTGDPAPPQARRADGDREATPRGEAPPSPGPT